MYSPNPSHIIRALQRELQHVPYQLLQDLLRSFGADYLSPQANLFELLYQAILTEFQKKSRLSTQLKVEDISTIIASQASRLNEQLGSRFKNVLNSFECIQLMRGAIQKVRANQQVLSAKQKMMGRLNEKRNELMGQQGRTKSQFNFELIKPQKFQQINMNKTAQKRTFQQCPNLTNKPQCICPEKREITSKDQRSFQCLHCSRYFHTVCMKRKSNSQFCCYCQIEKMVPTKRVVRSVFLGIFSKNIKKHMTSFFVPQIEGQQKFQVRCLRLKEGAPAACLFPDMTEISMNGHHVKELQPINKQSCLKYRKDEPFTLIKGDYYPNQLNTLTLCENVSSVKEKQARNESQNHLFGIYVIEDIKMDSLVSEIQEENIIGYSQSAAALNDCFANFGKEDEELTCQLVKIPLSCPLSTVRIDIPARGMFCKHFQCFDLKNYLTLISESANPRWNCPICKVVAYELIVDPIILQILKNIRTNQKIQQILFFRNGDYTSIVDEQPQPTRNNIKNLNIPQKKKVKIPQIIEQKPNKRSFQLPENANIIELD